MVSFGLAQLYGHDVKLFPYPFTKCQGLLSGMVSQTDMHTTIGLQTIVYWYASSIKKPKYKKRINNKINK
jgi:hypothetical protein